MNVALENDKLRAENATLVARLATVREVWKDVNDAIIFTDELAWPKGARHCLLCWKSLADCHCERARMNEVLKGYGKTTSKSKIMTPDEVEPSRCHTRNNIIALEAQLAEAYAGISALSNAVGRMEQAVRDGKDIDDVGYIFTDVLGDLPEAARQIMARLEEADKFYDGQWETDLPEDTRQTLARLEVADKHCGFLDSALTEMPKTQVPLLVLESAEKFWRDYRKAKGDTSEGIAD